MFKDALSALPSRPALFAAPLIVVLVLTFYYRELYLKCTDIEQHRTALTEMLATLDPSSGFRLAEFTRFPWDKVRIVAQLEADSRSTECPFGWNWPSGERETLATGGLLSAMIFAEQGTIIKYLEIRNDEVAFRGADTSLTPDTAVFDIDASGGAFALTLRR